MKCVRAYGWTQTYFVKYILLVPRNIYNTTEEHWKVEHELTASHGFLAVTIAGVVTHAVAHEWHTTAGTTATSQWGEWFARDDHYTIYRPQIGWFFSMSASLDT